MDNRLSGGDYYPFGMGMVGRESSAGGSYRYGFNGKEKDNEESGQGNQYDYGFRIYNPRIGKFLSTDPLSRSFPWYTPYQFAGNTPVFAMDLDGLEIRNAYYNYSNDGTRLELINPKSKAIAKLAKKTDEAIAQLQKDDIALYNWANQFNIKIQGATKEDIKKFRLKGTEAGFIKTDIKFNDEILDPDGTTPARAYNTLNGKDAWSKYREKDPDGAAQFASDFKSGKIKVFTGRTTTVNEQTVYLDFASLDDILSGRTNAKDATTGEAVKGDYGETLKHEIGHFLYNMLGIVFRNQTALEDDKADEKFADDLDGTFDNDPKTQTVFWPFFFMKSPPTQTVIINRADGTQNKSEMKSTTQPPPNQ